MLSAARSFFKLESASGIVLMAAALLAMLIANSPVAPDYLRLLAPFQLPIKDGLMVIFFWLIGLEIKREIVEGELSTAKKASLPLIGAAGGVIFPALIYAYFNQGTPEIRGWAVPCATDIAFALGVVALFGSRMNSALKVFLMALAVIDDLIAVMIIALFYSGGLSYPALGGVLACTIILWSMNRSGVDKMLPFVLVGLVLWVCMLLSGVHATVAGVILGLIMPLDLAKRAIHALHPWVAFGIMPIFAFANAGVPLAGMTLEHMTAPMPLGIMLGLFFGKQLGIFGFCWVAVKIGIARLPERATWLELYAVGIIAGIGFTMSLFIGMLAFLDPKLQDQMRLGVLGGSLLSAVVGSALMAYALRRKLSKP
jgi:NhaA family Na+:H+ antiporter